MEQTGKTGAIALFVCFLLFGTPTGKAVEENASVELRFALPGSSSVPDFQKHVVPLLGKLGCSSAKCHGSFQGAGDFRLSLFGFDFQKDHAALLDEASSEDENRVNLTAPEQSLILLKPTRQIKHRGGEVIKKNSWEYNLLHRWIEGGAKGAQMLKTEKSTSASKPVFSREGITFFNEKILPLFENNCYECHGHNQSKGDFQLKTRDDVLLGGASGEPAIVPGNVEKSLLIEAVRHTDPDFQMPPERKLEANEIRDLERWVSLGAPWPDTSDLAPTQTAKKLAQLHFEPSEILFLKTDDTAQIRIVAEWGDGEREDVTSLTRFRTNDDAVVMVDESGLASSNGKGDTHIVALYDNGIAAIPVLRPRSGDLPKIDVTKYPNPIDKLVGEKLNKLGITPSAPCSDTEFLRRVSIDLTGTLPSPDEVLAFIADQAADKRFRKTDELLERPSYAAWWANKLCDFTGCNPTSISSLLEVAREDGYVKATRWYDWIYEKIASNRPYVELVEGIMLANLSRSSGDGMPYFWTRQSLEEPKDTAMSVAHSFLGIQLQCAECHKHPFDQWTQNDFADFSNFFDSPMLKTGRKRRSSSSASADEKELSLLRSHRVTIKDKDPRKPIMDWLKREDNPWFARSFVNRVWAGYFNVGIVEPTDEFTPSNPPSNPDLLNWLAQGFIDNGYDMKWLHRQIVSSETYQRSWRPNKTNRDDLRNYSRAIPRRIPAEIIYDAMKQATVRTDQLEKVRTDLKRRGTGHLSMRMAGTHAMKVFGKPDRAINCDCERVNQPTLLQSIFLQNDPLVRMRLDNSGWITEVSESGQTDFSKLINDAWLRSINRLPRPEEVARAKKHLSETPSTEEGLTDLLWALMNTKEFILNH
ncbi:MAG: PSD1 and planctomycete cytochrome C domain-containing protein [Verrucomicrobiota bacterium]|jgi:hypothetical protein|nr:PSD1 and planctomycete cytochrome C domain-containing protein [Verrucomicrobiota bacterium]